MGSEKMEDGVIKQLLEDPDRCLDVSSAGCTEETTLLAERTNMPTQKRMLPPAISSRMPAILFPWSASVCARLGNQKERTLQRTLRMAVKSFVTNTILTLIYLQDGI